MKKDRNPAVRRVSDSQHGFTLTELIVVVFILAFVGSITTAGIVTALASARDSTERIEATQELEIAGQRIIRELRAAQELVFPEGMSAGTDPTSFGLRLDAIVRRDGEAFRIEFEVVAPDVIPDADSELGDDVQSTEPARLFATTRRVDPVTLEPVLGTSSEQILVAAVDQGDEPVFRYLDARGDDLAGRCGLSCATTFAGAERVEVVLRRQLRDERRLIVVRSSAALRNVRFDS